jgi:hypothetical protein
MCAPQNSAFSVSSLAESLGKRKRLSYKACVLATVICLGTATGGCCAFHPVVLSRVSTRRRVSSSSPSLPSVRIQQQYHRDCRHQHGLVLFASIPVVPNAASIATGNSTNIDTKTTSHLQPRTQPPNPLSRTTKKESSSKQLTTALAFLTGVADVFLIRKYQTFCTMMTGNTMWMMKAATECQFSLVGYYVAVISSYIAGLIIFRKAEMTWKTQSLGRFCAPFVTISFLLADFWSSRNAAIRWPAATLLSASYGIINSVGSEMAGALAFVVTGHMTKLTHVLTDRFSKQAGNKPIADKDKSTLLQSSLIIVGFAAGAFVACALLFKRPHLLDQWGAFTALGILYGSLFVWQDRESIQAWWLAHRSPT